MNEKLLAVDVGNTHTIVGLFDRDELQSHWRIETDCHSTADQIAVMISSLLTFKGLKLEAVDQMIVSSVVPTLSGQYELLAGRYLKTEAIIVGPGTKTGLPILINNPHELGADRIVNAVAALEKLGGPCIVVDFGTATTFCAISADEEYLGGAIAPGVEVSLEALTSKAARLSMIDLGKPESVIGKTTAKSLCSGVILGFAGLVDGIVGRMENELGEAVPTIATGGYADLVVPYTNKLSRIDPLLTLKGLKLINVRNQTR